MSNQQMSYEAKIDRMSMFLQSHEGKKLELGANFRKYFDLIYYHKGQEDEKFECARELYDVIDEEIRLCGYFVIITSEKMTAEDALNLYKSRDASEKLFRGDKSYLGNRSFRIQSNESLHAKIFIEFVALIVRNRFHKYLKERMVNSERKFNFMTVPAAVRELEKIEMLRQPDGSYRLDHAVTATQKEILKAFHMTAKNITEQANEINEDIHRMNQ